MINKRPIIFIIKGFFDLEKNGIDQEQIIKLWANMI